MKDLIKPAFQTKDYDPKKVIRCRDRYQCYLYLKHGAYPVDMYVSAATEDLIMVFDKAETHDLYEKYRRYELE